MNVVFHRHQGRADAYVLVGEKICVCVIKVDASWFYVVEDYPHVQETNLFHFFCDGVNRSQ